MNTSGWIKLHRSAEDHPVLANATRRGLFDRMCLLAASAPRRLNWRDQTIQLQRGQLALSVREFAETNELEYKVTRTHLERLAREGMISIASIARVPKGAARDTGKGAASGADKGAGRGAIGSLITICNYELYQSTLRDIPEGQGAARGAPRSALNGTDQGAASGAIKAQQGRTEQEVRESKNLLPTTESLTPQEVVVDPRSSLVEKLHALRGVPQGEAAEVIALGRELEERELAKLVDEAVQSEIGNPAAWLTRTIPRRIEQIKAKGAPRPAPVVSEEPVSKTPRAVNAFLAECEAVGFTFERIIAFGGMVEHPELFLGAGRKLKGEPLKTALLWCEAMRRQGGGRGWTLAAQGAA